MLERNDAYNYLFVSDLHIAMGKDATLQAYNPREDFLYDQEFCNFLNWAESIHKEKGTPWELVIVGDGFDFLPVELSTNEEFSVAYDTLAEAITDKNDRLELGNFFHDESIPLNLRKDLFKEFLQKKLLKRTDSDSCSNGYCSDKSIDRDPSMEKIETLPNWANEIIEDPTHDELAVPRKDRKEGYCYQLTINKSTPRWKRMIAKWRIKLTKNTFQKKLKFFLITQEGAVLKLKRIASGHPVLFQGLAEWIANGNRLVVLAGNHDLEIRWPDVQTCFKDTLLKYHNAAPEWQEDTLNNTNGMTGTEKDEFRSRIDFKYSWFYYKPGIFYAEHGGQYEPLNSSPNFLEPYEPFYREQNERKIYLPFGSLGVWLMVARLEDIFPQFEILGDHSGAILQLFKKHPFIMIRSAAENIGNLSRMAWRTFLSTTGATPGKALLRSFQMAIVGFLHWITFGVWYQIKYVARCIFIRVFPNPWYAQDNWYRIINRVHDFFSKIFQEPEYHPYPTEKKLNLFSKIAMLKPQTARKIYESWYPNQEQFQKCADESGLDANVIKKLYYTWDKPVDLYRFPMFLFLSIFSIIGYLLYLVNLLVKMLLWLLNPMGGLAPLLAILFVIQWLSIRNPASPDVLIIFGNLGIFASNHIIQPIRNFFGEDVINFLSDLYKATTDNTIMFIVGILFAMFVLGYKELMKRTIRALDVKFFNYFIDNEEYILDGADGVRKILNMQFAFESEKLPCYYIMGHDHKPMVRLLDDDEFERKRIYFYNTGSWLPWFADQDLRRMRTGGLDNEFTFVKISRADDNSWESNKAEYLRWNDCKNQPQEQIEIAVKKDKQQTRLFGGWPAFGLFIGAIAGIILLAPNMDIAHLFISGALGTLIGWGIDLGIKSIKRH